MEKLKKPLMIVLIVLAGLAIVFLSVSLYGKWESNQSLSESKYSERVNPYKD